MKVALASTSVLALPTYRALKNTSHEFLGIITKNPKQSGRGLNEEDNDLVEALSGEKIFRISNQEELVNIIEKLCPDLVITISFGMLIKERALKIPEHGWINLHFSLLPNYRGAAPVQRAILAGERSTGVSVFKLDNGMDTGPIFSTRSLEVLEKDSGTLLRELAELGSAEVLKSLEMIESGIAPTPQKGTGSLAPKIATAEAQLDFTFKAEIVSRKIRAFAPKPGAWCTFRKTRIKILAAKEIPFVGLRPGEILALSPLTIACSESAISVITVQEAGKKIMSAQDWLRGSRAGIGEFFE